MGTVREENRLVLTTAFWRLAQRVFRGVMTDVVYWTTEDGMHRIAFVGHPMKVAQIFGMLDGDGSSSPYLAPQIGNAVRSEMGVPLTEMDMRSDWERSPAGLGDLLDRLSGQTAWQWAEAHGAPIGDEGVRVGFIPEPGYPWPTEGKRYWSAKQQRWLPSKEPGWLIEVESRDEPGVMVPGVNPCLVFPADETKTEKGGPVCGELSPFPLPIMAAHSMRLMDPRLGIGAQHKQLDQAIAGIRGCGGLLFPSLSVGPIPATNFGPIVLVAHLELILASLLPYRRHKRRRPCWVYGSDAWTETTGSLMRDTAMELFSELHGDEDWIGRYIATLGVPASTRGSVLAHKWHDPLSSTRQLASSLRMHMRGWLPDMGFDEFVLKNEASVGESKYAYTEAKAREVVLLDEFPFLIAPRSEKKSVDAFVRGVGYKGKVVLAPMRIESSSPEREAYTLYQWAWQVADIVRDLRPVVEIAT